MGLALRQAQAVQKLEAYSKTKGKIQKNTQKVQNLDKFGKVSKYLENTGTNSEKILVRP